MPSTLLKPDIDNAEEDLFRHLQEGHHPRSRTSLKRIRDLVHAVLESPAHRRIAARYRMSVTDLCLACMELLTAMPDRTLTDASGRMAITIVLSDLSSLERFLAGAHAAGFGLAERKRRLAIAAYAQSCARLIKVEAPVEEVITTKTDVLGDSIWSGLPTATVLLVIAIFVALYAAYLL